MQPRFASQERGVTELDYETKLGELDRLLNDPEVPMEPARIWSLLAEISEYTTGNERGATARATATA